MDTKQILRRKNRLATKLSEINIDVLPRKVALAAEWFADQYEDNSFKTPNEITTLLRTAAAIYDVINPLEVEALVIEWGYTL